MEETRRGFGSDNHAGMHPEVLAAMAAANRGHVPGYGEDPFTDAAVAHLRRHFGEDAQVFFVFNGTGANVLSVAAACRSYQAVVCAESAHLNTDECGAPEHYTGCKLLTVATPDGRLTPELVAARLPARTDEHVVQPALVSVTQASEVGTVYTPAMLRELADAVHGRGMGLHMDGARLANAAVSLNCGLGSISRDVGVDLLSFGGTKNGMMLGEAVIVFNPALAEEMEFLRKQSMQLGSKMRFISAQFSAMLADDLWRRCASHANAMARRLGSGLRDLPGVALSHPVEANGVFVRLPPTVIPSLQEEFRFSLWNAEIGEVRLMSSFDTTEEDVDRFLQRLGQQLETARMR